MKKFSFVVSRGQGTHEVRYVLTANSNHLNGAVRKLYQMYDFDDIKKIL